MPEGSSRFIRCFEASLLEAHPDRRATFTMTCLIGEDPVKHSIEYTLAMYSPLSSALCEGRVTNRINGENLGRSSANELAEPDRHLSIVIVLPVFYQYRHYILSRFRTCTYCALGQVLYSDTMDRTSEPPIDGTLSAQYAGYSVPDSADTHRMADGALLEQVDVEDRHDGPLLGCDPLL